MLATPAPVGATAFAVCAVTLLRLVLEEVATAGALSALPQRAGVLAAFLFALHALHTRALRHALPGPAPGAGILVAIALSLALLSPLLALVGGAPPQPGVAAAQRFSPLLVDPEVIPLGVSLALAASVLWLVVFAARRGASAVALVQAGAFAWMGLVLLLHVEWIAGGALGLAPGLPLQAQLLALVALLLHAPRRLLPFAFLLLALVVLVLRGHGADVAIGAAGALGFLLGDRPGAAWRSWRRVDDVRSMGAAPSLGAVPMEGDGHRSLALLVLVLALVLQHPLLGLALLLVLLLTRGAAGQAMRASAPPLTPPLRSLRHLPLALALALVALTPPLL